MLNTGWMLQGWQPLSEVSVEISQSSSARADYTKEKTVIFQSFSSTTSARNPATIEGGRKKAKNVRRALD